MNRELKRLGQSLARKPHRAPESMDSPGTQPYKGHAFLLVGPTCIPRMPFISPQMLKQKQQGEEMCGNPPDDLLSLHQVSLEGSEPTLCSSHLPYGSSVIGRPNFTARGRQQRWKPASRTLVSLPPVGSGSFPERKLSGPRAKTIFSCGQRECFLGGMVWEGSCLREWQVPLFLKYICPLTVTPLRGLVWALHSWGLGFRLEFTCA